MFAAVGGVVLMLALWGMCASDSGMTGVDAQLSRPLARVPRDAGRVPDVAAGEVRQSGFGALVAVPLPVAALAPDYSYSNVDPQTRGSGRYDPRELAVLQAIIDLNELSESSSDMDFDNGDGVFEPLELGTQIWCGGHLRELYTGAGEYASFGYGLRSLPASIGDLAHLTRLNLSANRLAELPETLSALAELRVLELYHNELRQLPQSLSRMESLEVLHLRGNRLQEIPEEVLALPHLDGLFIADNPLLRFPEQLLNTQAARAPRVVRRGVDCSAES
jgi:hypothetical protein